MVRVGETLPWQTVFLCKQLLGEISFAGEHTNQIGQSSPHTQSAVKLTKSCGAKFLPGVLSLFWLTRHIETLDNAHNKTDTLHKKWHIKMFNDIVSWIIFLADGNVKTGWEFCRICNSSLNFVLWWRFCELQSSNDGAECWASVWVGGDSGTPVRVSVRPSWNIVGQCWPLGASNGRVGQHAVDQY